MTPGEMLGPLLEAEAATGVEFEQEPVRRGYDGRSAVVRGAGAEVLLKVFHRHRCRDRLRRELAGARAAAGAAGLRAPEEIAHAGDRGGASWLVTHRLPGRVLPGLPDVASTALLGQMAARLAGIEPGDGQVPEFDRRWRQVPRGRTRTHRAAERLEAALTRFGPERADRWCTRTFVHGDLTGRNVLVEGGVPPGLVEFERSGIGCPGEDLASVLLHECLLGGRSIAVVLGAYDAELRRLGAVQHRVAGTHLAWHVAVRARWVAQWAIGIDQPLALKIHDWTPWLIDVLQQPRLLEVAR